MFCLRHCFRRKTPERDIQTQLGQKNPPKLTFMMKILSPIFFKYYFLVGQNRKQARMNWLFTPYIENFSPKKFTCPIFI